MSTGIRKVVARCPPQVTPSTVGRAVTPATRTKPALRPRPLVGHLASGPVRLTAAQGGHPVQAAALRAGCDWELLTGPSPDRRRTVAGATRSSRLGQAFVHDPRHGRCLPHSHQPVRYRSKTATSSRLPRSQADRAPSRHAVQSPHNLVNDRGVLIGEGEVDASCLCALDKEAHGIRLGHSLGTVRRLDSGKCKGGTAKTHSHETRRIFQLVTSARTPLDPTRRWVTIGAAATTCSKFPARGAAPGPAGSR